MAVEELTPGRVRAADRELREPLRIHAGFLQHVDEIEHALALRDGAVRRVELAIGVGGFLLADRVAVRVARLARLLERNVDGDLVDVHGCSSNQREGSTMASIIGRTRRASL